MAESLCFNVRRWDCPSPPACVRQREGRGLHTCMLCMFCSAGKGDTGSHKAASTQIWSTLGAVLPWVVLLVSQEGSTCARDEKRHQKGGELQHVEKEQTEDWQRNHKLKTESPVLPCLAYASCRSWKLCWDHKVASGVKMQSLGLDAWPACAKKAGGLWHVVMSASVLVHPSRAIHKSL